VARHKGRLLAVVELRVDRCKGGLDDADVVLDVLRKREESLVIGKPDVAGNGLVAREAGEETGATQTVVEGGVSGEGKDAALTDPAD